LKLSLQTKLSQSLALTPQLQQSIRLLQLSTLELNQELEQVLMDNPMLERLDDPLDNCVRLDASGGLDSQTSAAPSVDGSFDSLTQGEAVSESTAPTENFDAGESEFNRDADQESYEGDRFEADFGSDVKSNSSKSDEEEREFSQLDAGESTLKEHLIEQLNGSRLSRKDRALIVLIIEELTEAGYLETSLEEIHALLPQELDIEMEEVEIALKLLQGFDPCGVAARNVKECLLLQWQAQPSPVKQETYGRLARLLINQHLDTLAARDFTKIKRNTRCDEEDLRKAQELILSFNPKPGASYGMGESTYVVPDVVVKKSRSGWKVQLNQDVMPKLRVNDLYADILRRNKGAASLNAQLQEARWLIKNVQQRFDTIMRVSQEIVERQKGFLAHGAVAMRPLVLREVADSLGLHESTISRVTTQKFMLTPHGTFELKYFFGSHVATDTGGSASSTAIRALIKQLVLAEEPKHPLSDSQIVELLAEQGIVVARRTIAKYREALNIAPVSQRRVL
jgi:RNA polymerase sigma-54 factor